MGALARTYGGMSVDEFLDWSRARDGRWQLADGEPVAMAPPSRTHCALQAELGALIRNHLLDGPCSVVVGPGIVPLVLSQSNMRVPDLAVSCADYASQEAALRDPVLVIETLSPGNRRQTWSNVWSYTTIPSVLEVVVLHSEMIGADVLRRRTDGGWPEVAASVTEGDLALSSIGFSVPLAALYRTTRLAGTGA